MEPQNISTVGTTPNPFHQRFEQLQGQLEELQRSIEELSETAHSQDKHVSATVGARGELRELVLDPRVFRNTDAKALATKITETIWDATRAVTTKLAELTSPMLGGNTAELEAQFSTVPPKSGVR